MAVCIQDIESGKVVGNVCIFGVKAGTTRGEVPVVLTMIGQTCTVTEEMFVIERYMSGRFRTELVAVE